MSFVEDVYRVISEIPKGQVMTYKQVAAAVGRPNAARAVGNAVKKNPDAPRVPCHRVVRSDGSVGGYVKGTNEKIKILKGEGLDIRNGKIH